MRRVLITGATGGIGQALARKYASLGYQLVLLYRSNDGKAEELALECENLGGEVHLYKIDVGDSARVRDLFQYIKDNLFGLDIIVNNAGVTRDNLILKMSDEEFDQVIRTNLYGVFNICREGAKLMFRQRRGNIVNVSSVVGLRGNFGQANYSASKAGLLGLTKSLAKELASRSIRVNAIAPGFIETEMTDGLQGQVRKEIMETIPMGRFGSPEEVADLVLFLTSDKSSYISGQVISIDGGMSI